jgi:dipeptidyl aminopeptidase/acylaminoacyl peptidase
LVFTPDINFKVGEIGESYLNSVLSAINNLYKESYIDSTSIGLQGASLGGYGVNYIITHTNKFAAALSGAGVSNLTSDYTWYSDGSGVRRYLQHENGQYRMGCTIWERPDLYIKNSPIFSTDKVNTPILLLHNKLDENVPYSQGLGFYIGLRRLQKKAWMLEYEGEFHGILNPANQLDFETRAIEFFDLYLKRRSVPNWLRGAD